MEHTKNLILTHRWCLSKVFLGLNFFDPKFFDPKFYFQTQNLILDTKFIVGHKILFSPNFFWTQKCLWTKIFFTLNFFDQKFIWTQNFSGSKLFFHPIFLLSFVVSEKVLVKYYNLTSTHFHP